jgi:hypothetical protein
VNYHHLRAARRTTANGGWGALILAVAGVAGVAAYTLARRSRRKWSAGCLTAITILSAISIARACSGLGFGAI